MAARDLRVCLRGDGSTLGALCACTDDRLTPVENLQCPALRRAGRNSQVYLDLNRRFDGIEFCASRFERVLSSA
jgi:hypothetical protein